jgi:PIN domain nuclease of toxin-antitoxin system
MTVVLDASALLASLKGEPGGDRVDGVLAESVMSSVNWAGKQAGLSLGDSLRDGIAERVWASLNLSLDIQVIR